MAPPAPSGTCACGKPILPWNGRTFDTCATCRRVARRYVRKTAPRAKTIAPKRLSKREQHEGARLLLDVLDERPKTRGECGNVERPCPFVSCKHHLYLDVNPQTGSMKLNFPDLEPHQLLESCSLDVADRGGITLEEVGELMNFTRERTRQLEVRALLKLQAAAEDEGLA